MSVSPMTRRLSVAVVAVAMLVMPSAGAETAQDPVTPPPVTVTVLGVKVQLFPHPSDVEEPDTRVGARVDVPIAGQQDIGFTHSEDEDPTGTERAVTAAACAAAEVGDPITYCETAP